MKDVEFSDDGKTVTMKINVTSCSFCRFDGCLVLTDGCWTCGGPLMHCPKCRNVICAKVKMVEHAVNTEGFTVTVNGK